MSGRKAKPIQLHIFEGNPNRLTKEEINHRQKTEIRIGNHEFKTTKRLRDNKKALKKWREIIGLYLTYQIDFVSTSDASLIERYCMTYSEYESLLDAREEIIKKKLGAVNTQRALDEFQVDNIVNKKLDILLKMERELFLTPLAKIKNIAVTEEEKEEPLKKAGFGNV
jgi:phage terminase small subunit